MFRNLPCALSWLILISLSAPDTPAQNAAVRPGEAEATAARRALVQQLGDPSFHARERAEEALASQGAAAEGALMEALKDPDPEIRCRACRILKRVAADTPAQNAAVRPGEAEATAAQRALVQQLGNPSYHARERAEEELAGQGVAAEAALKEALKDPDFEIRSRARRILKRVRQRAFEARLAAFIADADGSRQLTLPGWERFRDLVGDRRDTRKLFADMTRYEGALLSAYEKRVPEMPELYAARIAWCQSLTGSGNPGPRFVPRPSLATLLLGFRVSKRCQTSNWAQRTLTRAQIEYAATDAWVGRKLYQKLQELLP